MVGGGGVGALGSDEGCEVSDFMSSGCGLWSFEYVDVVSEGEWRYSQSWNTGKAVKSVNDVLHNTHVA